MNIINTREDLDAVVGTDRHTEFIALLKGSMTRKQDSQVYPDDYNQPEYAGEALEPIWLDVEDLSTIERFGFSKEELAADPSVVLTVDPVI
jgi:hypothetical protein